MKISADKHDFTHTKEVTSTMEDYLKTIFELNKNKKVVRVKDIARELGVKMPSVTSMLKKLASRGLVKYKRYEYVELEDIGTYYAKELYRKHKILLRFFADTLMIEKKTASKEACLMEHLLSRDTLSALADFMNLVESCPKAREMWPVRFKTYRENGCVLGSCQQSEANVSRLENPWYHSGEKLKT